MKVFLTLIAALFFVSSPAWAQCGCYGYGPGGWQSSTWGGQGALPVTPDYGYYGGGPVIIDPFPSISAYGYRNGYYESDDETYGYRPPIEPYGVRPPLEPYGYRSPLVHRYGGHRYQWVRVK
jgi:hypothetical protein